MGHLIAAAGSVEAITCLLAIRDDVLPPTRQLRDARSGVRPRLRSQRRPAKLRCGERCPTASASADRTSRWFSPNTKADWRQRAVLVVVLGILAGLIVLDLVIQIARRLSRSCPFWNARLRSPLSRPSPAPAAERVAFRTPDGVTLHASLHLPARGAARRHGDLLSRIGRRPLVGHLVLPRPDGEPALRSSPSTSAIRAKATNCPATSPIHWLTEFEVTDALCRHRLRRKRRPTLRELAAGPLRHQPRRLGRARGRGPLAGVQCVACEGVFSISTMSLHYTLRWASLYHPAWIMRLYPMWHIRSTLAVARWVSQVPPALPLRRARKLAPQTGGTARPGHRRRPRHVRLARNQRIPVRNTSRKAAAQRWTVRSGQTQHGPRGRCRASSTAGSSNSSLK